MKAILISHVTTPIIAQFYIIYINNFMQLSVQENMGCKILNTIIIRVR